MTEINSMYKKLKMALPLITAIILVLGSSCQKVPELSDREREKVKEEVWEIIDQLIYTQGDGQRFNFDELKNTCLDTASNSWIGNPGYDIDHPGPTLSPEEHISLFWPEIENMSQTNDSFNIEQFYAVINKDKVLTVLSADIVESPAETASSRGWAGSFIWIRKEEGWKLLHFQVSLSRAYSIMR